MGFLKKVMAAASSSPAAAGNRRPPNPQYVPYQPPADTTPTPRPMSNAATVTATAYAASPKSTGGPVKYIKVAGVMKLNPEYKTWQQQQTGTTNNKVHSESMPNSKQALPVVSSMEDHAHLNADLGTNIPLAESTDATIEKMQTPQYSKDTGMNPDTIVNELGSMLSKYEVPLGLINKVRDISVSCSVTHFSFWLVLYIFVNHDYFVPITKQSTQCAGNICTCDLTVSCAHKTPPSLKHNTAYDAIGISNS